MALSAKFPTSTGGKPWVRLDSRTGIMTVSGADGGTKFDPKGKTMAFDIARARQGWLAISATGLVDWVDVVGDAYGNPPTADHKAAIELDVYSTMPEFSDMQVRSMRGNSQGFCNFILAIAAKAGDVPDELWPVVKITTVRTIKVGAGSTISIDFDMAPREKWQKRSTIDAGMSATAAPKATKKAENFADAEF